ncbi:MAG: haloacid dehalogenase-like hydrolase [Polyangiales bacterium]
MTAGDPGRDDTPVLEALEAGAIVERLEAALASLGDQAAALATDGDGTLWTDDIGEALFHTILERGLVGRDALVPLLAEARTHGVVVEGDATPVGVARALWDSYVARGYPEDRMCAAMAWCGAGNRNDVYDMLSVEILHGSFDLRRHLIAESAHVLQWAQRRGLPIYLVSASPRAVVERAATMIATEYAIDTPQVLAMTPLVEDGVVRPTLTGTWTYGEGKVEALSRELAVDQRRLVAALGDNVFDAAMLRAACIPIAIRPKPALVTVAASIPGLVRASIMT